MNILTEEREERKLVHVGSGPSSKAANKGANEEREAEGIIGIKGEGDIEYSCSAIASGIESRQFSAWGRVQR